MKCTMYMYVAIQDTARSVSHLWVEREAREACHLHETQFCKVIRFDLDSCTCTLYVIGQLIDCPFN